MSSIEIRRAQEADRDLLVSWNQAMALETEGRHLSTQKLALGVQAVLQDSGKGFYLIAERAGEAVGGLLVTFEWSDWRNTGMWWLQSVYVVSEARGQGIFRALFSALKSRARKAGAAALRLYVERDNVNAQQVYRTCGMRHSNYLMYEIELD